MGFTVGWFAVAETTLEATAKKLGLDLGEQMDYPKGMCIAAYGPWVLVYSDGQPLQTDEELAALSKEHTVALHEAVDSVMYARSVQWDSGEITWSATVDLGAADESEAVRTSGLSPVAEKSLHRMYQRSGPSAYSDVTDLAAELVGFRHDQVSASDIVFRQLIDNRVAPRSTPDRAAAWLMQQGFEAKDETADGSKKRSFRRKTDGDYWVIVEIEYDRSQYYDDWCFASFGIRHDGVEAVLDGNNTFAHDRDRRFDSSAQVTFALHGPGGRPYPVRDEPIPFDDLTADLQHGITEAESYCTDERFLGICRPRAGLALEVALGWSNRSESYRKQTEVHNRLVEHHNTHERAVDLQWVEPFRESVRTIEPRPLNRPVQDLCAAFDADEHLTGVELAAIQVTRGASDDALVEALSFEHWLRVFDHRDALPTICAYIVRHHLLVRGAEAIARAMQLSIEVQRELISHSEINVPFQLGFNTALDPETQIALAGTDRPTVGGHPDLVPEAQRIIVTNGATFELAQNPSLLEELQPDLAKSKQFHVREGLARNVAILPELLAKLVKDRKGEVRRAAAANPTLTERLQLALLDGANADSRGGLMANPALTPAAQQRIADQGDLVRIAGNPSLLPELMEILAASERPHDRAALGRREQLPRELQVRLANDPDPSVRRTIANRVDLDPAVRKQLVNDSDDDVCEVARKRSARLS